jgi:arginine:ornithine antiporter/lysine permease
MSEESKTAEGKKGFGFWAMVITIFSTMVGTGVYDLSYQLGSVASPGAAIIAFVICYIGTLVSVLSLSNLLNKEPEGDGFIIYARKSMGKFAEFLSAWGYWISGWVGNVSFATMMMIALGTFFPEIFGDTGANWPSIIFASVVMWLLFLLVSRGVESSMAFSNIVTVIKIIPLFVFIVVTIGAFDLGVFTTDFWTNFAGNVKGGGFDLSSVASQVNGSMLSLIWLFIGAESAALLSNHAESKQVAGRATIVGLTLVTIVEFTVTMIPYGLMTADEFVALGEPSVGQVLVLFLGPVGAGFIEAALIISIFGSWIMYTVMPTESITYLADEGSLPAIFGKKNKNGVATFSLFITTILAQILLISVHFTEDAYNFTFSLCGSAILICWVFIDLYQVQRTLREKETDGLKGLGIGLVGLIYYLVIMFVSGIEYVVLCFVLYLIGIPLYYKARKDSGDEKVFDGKERILLIGVVALAVIGCFVLPTVL